MRPTRYRFRFLIMIIGHLLLGETSTSAARPLPLYRWVERAAQQHGIERALLLAIVMAESSGDPEAISPAKAYGLGQLLLPTARRYEPSVLRYDLLYDPLMNLDLAAQHLAELRAKVRATFPNASLYWRVQLIAASYNCGLNRVITARGIPRINETQVYTKRVLKLYKQYRSHWPGR